MTNLSRPTRYWGLRVLGRAGGRHVADAADDVRKGLRQCGQEIYRAYELCIEGADGSQGVNISMARCLGRRVVHRHARARRGRDVMATATGLQPTGARIA